MSLHRNLFLGSLHSFFSMFLLVVPILVPYWQSLGLTMGEILEVQAIFGVAVALLEVPTGYIADMWSRKASICIGTFVSGCGFSMLPWATTYESLVLFEVILALGSSLVSGADISIVYDSLPADAHRLKRLGSLSLWSLVGEATAAVTAGILVLWSFQSVLWAQALVGWAPFLVALFYVEPPIEKMPHESHLKNFGVVVKHLVRGDPLMRAIFINSVVWGLSSFCVVWLIQPYWIQEKVPLSWFGVLWAVLMLVAAAVSKWTHIAELHWGAPGVFKALSASVIAGYFLMAFGGGWIGVAAGTLFFVTRGLSSVMFNDAFNWRVPSSFRSTANSMRSLFFRLSYGVLGPGTGLVLDRFGLSVTLAVLGSLSVVAFLVLMLPLCRKIGDLHVEYIPTE